MGREVRKVPKNYKHPTNSEGSYMPQCEEAYEEAVKNWVQRRQKWIEGYREKIIDKEWQWVKNDKEDVYNKYFEDYEREYPNSRYYMQQFLEKEKTHYMMFETCSEGTPLSPACATKKELAQWLADNKASTFGDMTATYEQWLGMIEQTSCVAMVITGNKMISGVETCDNTKTK